MGDICENLSNRFPSKSSEELSLIKEWDISHITSPRKPNHEGSDLNACFNSGLIGWLPRELRDQIYEYALYRETSCKSMDCRCSESYLASTSGLGLLTACKLIHSEACRILYQKEPFLVLCGSFCFDDNKPQIGLLERYVGFHDRRAGGEDNEYIEGNLPIAWKAPAVYHLSKTMGTAFHVISISPEFFGFVEELEIHIHNSVAQPEPESEGSAEIEMLSLDDLQNTVDKLVNYASSVCKAINLGMCRRTGSMGHLVVNIEFEWTEPEIPVLVPLLEPFKILRGIIAADVQVNIHDWMGHKYDRRHGDKGVHLELSEAYEQYIEHLMQLPSEAHASKFPELLTTVQQFRCGTPQDETPVECKGQDIDEFMDSLQGETNNEYDVSEGLRRHRSEDEDMEYMAKYLRDVYGVNDNLEALYGTVNPIWAVWVHSDMNDSEVLYS